MKELDQLSDSAKGERGVDETHLGLIILFGGCDTAAFSIFSNSS